MAERLMFMVPARNEALVVGSVIADLRQNFPSAEIVVIDDGSTDATRAEAERAGARVLQLPVNLGIGGAVQTGLIFAARRGYDIAVQVDGDGQHRADQVAKLLAPIREGKADAVIGSRFLGSDYRPVVSRRLGMAMFNAVNTLMMKRRFTDTTSGFRAYNRKAILFLARTYADDYPEPESILVLQRHQMHVIEVPVEMRVREHGASSITFIRSIYYVMKVLLAILVSATRRSHHHNEMETSSDEPASADHLDHREPGGRAVRI